MKKLTFSLTLKSADLLLSAVEYYLQIVKSQEEHWLVIEEYENLYQDIGAQIDCQVDSEEGK